MQVAVRVEQHFKFRPSDRCIRGVDPQYRKNYEHGTTFAVCCCYTCLDHCHRKWARYLLYICRGGHGSRSSRREAPQVPTNALASIVPHTQPTGLHERNKSPCSGEEHINARMGLCEASRTYICDACRKNLCDAAQPRASFLDEKDRSRVVVFLVVFHSCSSRMHAVGLCRRTARPSSCRRTRIRLRQA